MIFNSFANITVKKGEVQPVLQSGSKSTGITLWKPISREGSVAATGEFKVIR